MRLNEGDFKEIGWINWGGGGLYLPWFGEKNEQKGDKKVFWQLCC